MDNENNIPQQSSPVQLYKNLNSNSGKIWKTIIAVFTLISNKAQTIQERVIKNEYPEVDVEKGILEFFKEFSGVSI